MSQNTESVVRVQRKQQEPRENIRMKAVEYIANPNETNIDRLSVALHLGYASASGLHNLFNSTEMNEIYKEALEIRRKRFAQASMEVDRALHIRAMSGDPVAIKLWYQRFEGWSERSIQQHEGELRHTHDVRGAMNLTNLQHAIKQDQDER